MRGRRRQIHWAGAGASLLLCVWAWIAGVSPAAAGRDIEAGAFENATLPAVVRGVEKLDGADTLRLGETSGLAEGVRDPIFGFLVGLLDGGRYGVVPVGYLDELMQEEDRRTNIPYRLIREVTRIEDPDGPHAWVRIRFHEPLRVAVPYSMLGYHPGTLLSTTEVVLLEWHLGDVQLPFRDREGRRWVGAQNVTIWGVVSGRIVLDIDGWVDAIMGGKLDDTDIITLGLFNYEGERFALAAGFNRDGQGRSGALDLATDKIRFPAPDEFKVIGRELRRMTINRLARHRIPAWKPREK